MAQADAAWNRGMPPRCVGIGGLAVHARIEMRSCGEVSLKPKLPHPNPSPKGRGAMRRRARLGLAMYTLRAPLPPERRARRGRRVGVRAGT